MPHPRVSVVLPVYDRATLVRRSIRSVLKQTFRDLELIVVDDGSAQNFAHLPPAFDDDRVRILRHDVNKGSAAARNTGISAARGDFIAFLDSDDFWHLEKLECQLAFMSGHDHARLSCTAVVFRSPHHPEGQIRTAPPLLTVKDMEWGCRVSPGSTLVAERSLFSEVGLLNEELRRLEDWDWLLRCLRLSDLAVLDRPLSVIDYGPAERVAYTTVKAAVTIMRRSHFVAAGILPTRSRLRFLATLENELAATAYRNRLYLSATRHFLKSLAFWPYRSFDHFKRIALRVVRDCRRSLDPRAAGG